MPPIVQNALKALADGCKLGSIMAADGGACETARARVAKSSVRATALASQVLDEDALSFQKSWNRLVGVITFDPHG